MKRVLVFTIYQKEVATKNEGDIGREKKKAEERGKGVKGSRSNSKKMLEEKK